MTECPGCQAHAQHVAFLQDQVRLLTEKLVNLQNPLLGAVLNGGALGAPAIEHNVNDKGEAMVTFAGTEISKKVWEEQLNNLERYSAGLPSIHEEIVG